MTSGNLQPLRDESEPVLEIIYDSNSNLGEVLKKCSTVSEGVKSEEVKVEFKISQNEQQLFRMCSRVFATCPTGQHAGGNCTHLVNC